MNYTRYFVINSVIKGYFNWLPDWLPERKQVIRLSYVILEEKADTLDGNFFYIYTGMCFEGTLIKKLLSAEGVIKLITSNYRSRINFSRCILKSLTDEEILNMVIGNVENYITLTSIKSKIHSYNI